MHIRDIEVLNKIKDYFKVGSVQTRSNDNKTTAIYAVQSIKELTTVIIPHFIKYPLITQKQADFALFAEIVELISNQLRLIKKYIFL